MINLLPPDYKSHLRYARYNTLLRKWLIASCAGLLGGAIIVLAGYLFIGVSTSSWQKQVDQTTAQLKEQKLEETQKRVQEISNSVKLVSDVLSKQILFSKLLSQIGAAMPPDSSLQSLSINSVEGGIDLTATAKDYNSATQVQVNLSDPANKIFERADIINVNCQTSEESGNECQVVLRALFAKDNSYQYRSTNE